MHLCFWVGRSSCLKSLVVGSVSIFGSCLVAIQYTFSLNLMFFFLWGDYTEAGYSKCWRIMILKILPKLSLFRSVNDLLMDPMRPCDPSFGVRLPTWYDQLL